MWLLPTLEQAYLYLYLYIYIYSVCVCVQRAPCLAICHDFRGGDASASWSRMFDITY